MSIVCFLDFAGGSSQVAVVSALIAARMNTPVHLAQSTGELAHSAAHRAREAWVSARLWQRAERMRALWGQVHTHVLPGPAERELSVLADRVDAQLIVSSALAPRADLLAQHARVPVLAVRDEVPFVRWASELSPLRVAAAVAGLEDLPVLGRMVRQFSAGAPCEVAILHVATSDAEAATEPLRQALRNEAGASHWKLEVALAQGPRAQQLITLARDAHVLMLGSRVMSRVSRLWERSVSRRVLMDAECSVLCLPLGGLRARRPIHSVLAATGLSDGAAALALALRIVAPGGVVHLAHVLSDSDPASNARALAQLKIAAEEHATEDVRVRLHVLHGKELASTLARAARQLGVDAVCVASDHDGSNATVARLMAEVGCALLFAERTLH